jgi:hypothetical protein
MPARECRGSFASSCAVSDVEIRQSFGMIDVAVVSGVAGLC